MTKPVSFYIIFLKKWQIFIRRVTPCDNQALYTCFSSQFRRRPTCSMLPVCHAPPYVWRSSRRTHAFSASCGAMTDEAPPCRSVSSSTVLFVTLRTSAASSVTSVTPWSRARACAPRTPRSWTACSPCWTQPRLWRPSPAPSSRCSPPSTTSPPHVLTSACRDAWFPQRVRGP